MEKQHRGLRVPEQCIFDGIPVIFRDSLNLSELAVRNFS